ncbi:hypothetical protein EDI_347920 [Entamoeba dispar SAW760]|uniref:AIG1-type G domain-containing protein n=1 Tax=Entamoeba dispar (strain ATCC PRA-260 / SAW760) TaxID=370354 RepID=B0E668_ENTDS|nr:uncharacterized protein EDI_347920 [Entamoeba dispar SAW760]EDR29975.1 hypothetical protein EDI_347920 [Entamoeba dispar SAW760]|eukprot:EDR29975.1 hypothetical protein EDI_347920 [Entamoeba dispar SAW760]
MTEQEGKSTKLLLVGETGSCKSSFGYFILKKNVFKVNSNPNSIAQETKECYGESNRKKEIVRQMVDYIKEHKEIQGIVICSDFNYLRSSNLKRMIKMTCIYCMD